MHNLVYGECYGKNTGRETGDAQADGIGPFAAGNGQDQDVARHHKKSRSVVR